MEERMDPVQIITRPSGGMAKNAVQVVGAWMAQTRKAGWHVVQVDAPVDLDAGERGVVEIEGLRYLIRVGPRGRTCDFIAPDEHVAAHAVEMVMGRANYPSQPAFGLTAWAKPILS